MSCENAASPPDDYRAKDDAHSLMRAEEIRADGKRVAAAMRHLEHAKAALKYGRRGRRKRGGEREAVRE